MAAMHAVSVYRKGGGGWGAEAISDFGVQHISSLVTFRAESHAIPFKDAKDKQPNQPPMPQDLPSRSVVSMSVIHASRCRFGTQFFARSACVFYAHHTKHSQSAPEHTQGCVAASVPDARLPFNRHSSSYTMSDAQT